MCCPHRGQDIVTHTLENPWELRGRSRCFFLKLGLVLLLPHAPSSPRPAFSPTGVWPRLPGFGGEDRGALAQQTLFPTGSTPSSSSASLQTSPSGSPQASSLATSSSQKMPPMSVTSGSSCPITGGSWGWPRLSTWLQSILPQLQKLKSRTVQRHPHSLPLPLFPRATSQWLLRPPRGRAGPLLGGPRRLPRGSDI